MRLDDRAMPRRDSRPTVSVVPPRHGQRALSLQVVVHQTACCQVKGRGAPDFLYSNLQTVECHW